MALQEIEVSSTQRPQEADTGGLVGGGVGFTGGLVGLGVGLTGGGVYQGRNIRSQAGCAEYETKNMLEHERSQYCKANSSRVARICKLTGLGVGGGTGELSPQE